MDSFVVTFASHNKTVDVPRGTSLLEAASRAGIALGNLCGGTGVCGRCKMIVTRGSISGEDFGKLTKKELTNGYVLGCHAFVEGEVQVDIPGSSALSDIRKSTEAVNRFARGSTFSHSYAFPLFPLVQKLFLALEKPTLIDNIADHQRVCDEVQRRLPVLSVQAGLAIMKELPLVLRKFDYRITATIAMQDGYAGIIGIEGDDRTNANYCAVVDIGTTTVVAQLINSTRADVVGSTACFNSQAPLGQEVTTRLIWAEKKGCDQLQRPIIDDLNRLIETLAEKQGIALADITSVVCAGNTSMVHFLLGLPVHGIRRTPYIASSVAPSPIRAAEIGLHINPEGLLFAVPGISAWVGGDITAGVCATGLQEHEGISLLVDIGTNGEVAIATREWLMACSASAGPALEGASVECGMRAEPGAIERVFVKDGRLAWKTVDDAPPKGLCGSGIIDLIAVLLDQGMVNRRGKMAAGVPEITTGSDGIKRYVLVKGESPVYVTETDIENVITAKAAIYAAITILLKRCDLRIEDVTHFYLSGAFGKHIDIENAVAIGLIPNISRKRVTFAGNTSLEGAALAALHRDAYEKMKEIARKAIFYDLMGAEDYVDEFRKALFLPHTDIEKFLNPNI